MHRPWRPFWQVSGRTRAHGTVPRRAGGATSACATCTRPPGRVEQRRRRARPVRSTAPLATALPRRDHGAGTRLDRRRRHPPRPGGRPRSSRRRVQPGQPQPPRVHVRGRGQPDEAEDRLPPVGATTPCSQAGPGRSREIGPDHVPAVQQRPQLAVERRPSAAAAASSCGGAGRDVPLHARRARTAPSAQRNARSAAPPGGVRHRRPDVAADQLRAAAAARSSAGSPAARAASLVSEAQTRSVRSRMPRSTRAPPEEHDSISRPGCRAAQLVQQPVDRQGLGADACRAGTPCRRRAVQRLVQVPVVVPLEVVDADLVDQRVEPSEQVGDASGWARSSTCWRRHGRGSRAPSTGPDVAAGSPDPAPGRAASPGAPGPGRSRG